MSRTRDLFAAVHTEGSMLPPDLLQRVMDRDKSLPGLAPADYHHEGDRLNELTAASWQRLQGRWLTFKDERAKLGEGDLGTTVTRERWLLPLFQELGYGRLQTARAFELDGRTYPVSHGWGHGANVPIHLVGCNVEMDAKTAGVAGAARSSPHSLVQELLNRSDDRLWAFVTNGLRLRILRDNVSLSRQAYVEFDLEAMLEGELYSDFVLLWLLCHESRVEGEKPEECWLEKWSQEAQQQGVRALDGLRAGVENAIRALGSGFLKQSANHELLEKLRDGGEGGLDKQDYYRQLLRMVYRLLFLFTAEDRGLLLDPGASEAAAQTYLAYYSTDRLRHLAERRRGSRHTDLYESLRLVMQKLGGDGCAELGLPALGSFLFADESVSDLLGCRLANRDLLEAVRHLAFTSDGRSLRAIDFRNLGAEELGSVYESLLEMTPVLEREAATFELKVVSGSERKTTGSYYTPSSLIQCLLDTALDPVVDERLAEASRAAQDAEERREAAQAVLLDLKVCDPACGSGHFLIAAAHRLARRLAAVRTGDEEPAPEATRHALRDVIGHCIYGVDINPMSVELCKVNLWMEALEPGKPLSFLDHRIQCGNSLLGATPALLHEGIPDDAFKPIEGDDKKVCTELRKQNREERAGQTSLFGRTHEPWQRLSGLATGLIDLEDVDDGTAQGVREKELRYESLIQSGDYLYGKLLADAWCAAFVWPKTADTAYQITEETFRRMEDDPQSVPIWIPEQVQKLAQKYGFLHWHLAFPNAFAIPATGQIAENERAGWDGGFDVVLGNPPWERVKLQEKEWFAAHDRDDIALAPTAAKRRRMIDELAASDAPSDRQLYEDFKADRRRSEGESQLLRNSGCYPLCGRGDVNTYAVFAELKRSLLSPTGRVGCIVPTGIATDDTTKYFFGDLVATRTLHSYYGFKNERFLFPKPVEHTVTFGLLTMVGSAQSVDSMEFCWLAWTVDEMKDPDRRLILTPEDIKLLNPNTHTCPVFRSRRDAEITKAIYRRVPVLIEEGSPGANPWGIVFSRLFDMTNDSHLFRTAEDFLATEWVLEGNVYRRGSDSWVPLYEAKMMHQFDHRWATYDDGVTRDASSQEKADRGFAVHPRYWVPEQEVVARLRGKWDAAWLLGWRDIARATDERTVIVGALPRVGAGNKIPLMFPANARPTLALCLLGCLDSYACDFASRQKIGGTTLNFFILQQIPVLPPSVFADPAPWLDGVTLEAWVSSRVARLVLTADDMKGLAGDLEEDAQVIWDDDERFALRCELDAAFFLLYGLTQEEIDYVMDTFHVRRMRDEEQHGDFRTKLGILDAYCRLCADSHRSPVDSVANHQ